MSNKKYFHVTGFEGTAIYFIHQSKARTDGFGNYYGPFETLKECKQDAISYHQATKSVAQSAINDIRKIKEKDLK